MKMGKSRIIVVDDDDDLRETIVMMLTDEGYDVHDFRSASEALLYVEGGGEGDLILLDLMMPDMNGWEFCEHRADSPRLSQIPVVVITARRAYATPKGISDILHKPFDAKALLDAIERHCAA